MIAELGNIHFSGPNENLSAHKDIRSRQGHLICVVDEEPPLPDQNPRELIEETVGDSDARWYVANLDCSIYAHDDHVGKQVANLREALRALARRLSA